MLFYTDVLLIQNSASLSLKYVLITWLFCYTGNCVMKLGYFKSCLFLEIINRFLDKTWVYSFIIHSLLPLHIFRFHVTMGVDGNNKIRIGSLFL